MDERGRRRERHAIHVCSTWRMWRGAGTDGENDGEEGWINGVQDTGREGRRKGRQGDIRRPERQSDSRAATNSTHYAAEYHHRAPQQRKSPRNKAADTPRACRIRPSGCRRCRRQPAPAQRQARQRRAAAAATQADQRNKSCEHGVAERAAGTR